MSSRASLPSSRMARPRITRARITTGRDGEAADRCRYRSRQEGGTEIRDCAPARLAGKRVNSRPPGQESHDALPESCSIVPFVRRFASHLELQDRGLFLEPPRQLKRLLLRLGVGQIHGQSPRLFGGIAKLQNLCMQGFPVHLSDNRYQPRMFHRSASGGIEERPFHCRPLPVSPTRSMNIFRKSE